MWAGDAEFNRKCGEVLEAHINIEQGLEHFISAYCGYCGSYERTINGIPTVFLTSTSKENIRRMLRLILPRLNFQQKLDIFREVCKAEKVEGNEHSNILCKIEHIQNVRNQVSHSERYFFSGPKLRKKRRKFISPADDFSRFLQEDKSSLELTDNLVKGIKQDEYKIVEYTYLILNKLLKARTR